MRERPFVRFAVNKLHLKIYVKDMRAHAVTCADASYFVPTSKLMMRNINNS